MRDGIEPLSKIAFEIGPLTVYWYGIIIGTGALLGLLLATREGDRRKLPKDTFIDLLMIAAPIAILCARLYYVIFKWDFYAENPGKIFAIWEGGLAIHGALIGSVLTAIVFAKVKKLSFWKLADIAAPSIILGQAVGRWGNFMNQEAHGGPLTQEQVDLFYSILPNFIMDQMHSNGIWFHPTFLYESVWNFLGLALLLILRRVNLPRGEIFLTYVIWYSFGRFYIEGLRTDSLMLTESLRVAQAISIGLIILAVALIIYRRKKGYSNKRYLHEG
ncbi:prolipoprotein diacylglyceryl transferase [Lottiidibacillus patelloidae]|uniref:Phosphatidylglycerol--prolipoprotein diacylglyceryl transferase n=1 Tax=Lottiidibacillus patelloidae TaxID=2670334 RepID=A0A263BS52_9BACI|nr:prolipoprotein diacylglyceryl transferase [Lottiidibacillus patelloidae]OZM56543.1 prolipoprotein diacylglyceryl transferase [Lottiidibacillus patelloidae]